MSNDWKDWTPETLRRLGFAQAPSGAWIKSQPVAGLDSTHQQQTDHNPPPGPGQKKVKTRAAKSSAKIRGSRSARAQQPKPLVIMTLYTTYLTDEQNYIGGCKWLQDAVAELLGLDDNQRWIDWRYHLVEVHSRREQGMSINIII